MTESAADRVRRAIAAARDGLVEREALVEIIVLGAVAREHVLVVGPPGTAKSEAVRRISRAFGGRYFEYLLGRFTEPSEIFGPIDLRKLALGEVVTETTGMLPEAEIAFLDELFLGSTAILNTLLGLLAERRYRRGHTDLKVPLRVCVAASNQLPDDAALAALADRFLLRVFVAPLPDSRLEDLLDGGARLSAKVPGSAAPIATLADVDDLAARAEAADTTPIRPALARAVRALRRDGIELSDRRIVKVQRLVAAAGVLAGRATPTDADLWPLLLAVPTAEDQARARESLHDLLERSENDVLVSAALGASAGPAARDTDLTQRAEALLATEPEPDLLRVEGLLRDIDAACAPESRSDGLSAARERLIAALQAPHGAPSP